jgi:hypothetical protein
MIYNQNSEIWFDESESPYVIRYEIDVMVDAYKIGDTHIVDAGSAVNGEFAIPLSSISAMPPDASGFFTFYIYPVDLIGRSDLPLIVFHVEVNFAANLDRLNPSMQDKRGVLLRNPTEPLFSGYHPSGDR